MKHVLIIGGTSFVGRNLVEKLITLNQYDITLFNRGVSNKDLFPEVKKLQGDRKSPTDLQQFTQKDWDYIIDVSGYWPLPLKEQFKQQTGKIGRYIYISTSCQYKESPDFYHLTKEEEAIEGCSYEEQLEDNVYKYYCAYKAECEKIVMAEKDLDYIIFRPGLIIGPYDYTERIYHWFHRIKTQNQVLIPKQAQIEIPYTHVHDLVNAVIYSLNKRTQHSIYNIASFHASIADIVKHLKPKLNPEVQFIKASPSFIKEKNIAEWTGFPLWISAYSHGNLLDCQKLQKDQQQPFTSMDASFNQLIDYYNHLNWPTPHLQAPPLSIEDEAKYIKSILSQESSK